MTDGIPICYYWTNGKCALGSNCNFAHHGPAIRPDGGICRYYGLGNCTRGAECNFLHIDDPSPSPSHNRRHHHHHNAHGGRHHRHHYPRNTHNSTKHNNPTNSHHHQHHRPRRQKAIWTHRAQTEDPKSEITRKEEDDRPFPTLDESVPQVPTKVTKSYTPSPRSATDSSSSQGVVSRDKKVAFLPPAKKPTFEATSKPSVPQSQPAWTATSFSRSASGSRPPSQRHNSFGSGTQVLNPFEVAHLKKNRENIIPTLPHDAPIPHPTSPPTPLIRPGVLESLLMDTRKTEERLSDITIPETPTQPLLIQDTPPSTPCPEGPLGPPVMSLNHPLVDTVPHEEESDGSRSRGHGASGSFFGAPVIPKGFEPHLNAIGLPENLFFDPEQASVFEIMENYKNCTNEVLVGMIKAKDEEIEAHKRFHALRERDAWLAGIPPYMAAGAFEYPYFGIESLRPFESVFSDWNWNDRPYVSPKMLRTVTPDVLRSVDEMATMLSQGNARQYEYIRDNFEHIISDL